MLLFLLLSSGGPIAENLVRVVTGQTSWRKLDRAVAVGYLDGLRGTNSWV